MMQGAPPLELPLEAPPVVPDTSGILCDGLRVSAIDVETDRPHFSGPMAIWRRVARQMGLHNTETVESVVRRYVTLDPGATCTEFRRAESERLLRAQPFIATASVRTLDDGQGGIRVLVRTVDEVPALVAARYGGGDWALALGNENTFGTGTRVLLRTERRRDFRSGYGAEIEHRQLLGRPYVLGLQYVQNPVGDHRLVSLGHAFLTDLQRIAWHTGIGERNDYLRLRADTDAGTLTLPLRRVAWDIGGVVRFGPPGRAFLSGGILTGERFTPAAEAVLVSDSGIVPAPPPDAGIAALYADSRTIRANLVGGFRSIRYRQARGFDALTAEQDVANGVQANVIVGKSIPRYGEDDDAFVASEMFAGYGGARSYAAIHVDGEARHMFGEGAIWEGILGSARAAWYYKPAPTLTSIASLEWAGAWRQRYPFLLELGDRQGGVRGFGGADMFGARRAVARLEERWVAGPVKGRGELGFAAFTDVGRVWAGDAPYGETSAVATSLGLSIIAAVPIGGQRTYRMDLAFPVSGPDAHGVELRFHVGDRTRHFWEPPNDVARAKSAAIPQRIVDWP